MPVEGQIVGGRYRLVRPLGEGGMASVWAAEHLTMGNTVAVKIISPDLLKHEVAVARFQREARAAAQLRSPYVVQLFDHDIDPELGPYIAMELLEGESLADRMDKERFLPATDLCRIMLQVGKGLMRAHAAGIVHRDLKPENIFLTVDEDGEETAKILDFGVAKANSPLGGQGGTKTVAGTLLGTLNYMSPEQAQGREVNHLTDLWALGVIAFESLVGRRPFDDEAPGAVVLQICAHPMPVPSALNPNVPPGFDDWFAQACNRDPALRFPSSQQLAQALAHVCDADALSLDDMLVDPSSIDIEVDQDLDEPIAKQPTAPPPPLRKRRVLQLIDSTPPPAIDEGQLALGSPVLQNTDVLDFDIDIELEYFVQQGPSTVGPVTLETLRAGYQAGHVVADARLWTPGWSAWREASEVFVDVVDRPRRRALPNLALVGPSCPTPPGAPPPPPRRPPPPPVPTAKSAAAPPPASAVRPAPGKPRPREFNYYVSDSGLTVGPVRAALLRRGLELCKVPANAWVWRQGWDDWKLADEVRAELETWQPAARGLLRNRPGIEAVGMKTRIPSGAPPLRATEEASQSK